MRLGLLVVGVWGLCSLTTGVSAQGDGAKALIGAALNDRPDRIEELVRSGVPVDAEFVGMTALCMVAGYDDSEHLESAKALLKAGANPNHHCGPAQRTPLHDAALDGDLALARLLLEHGADRKAQTKFGRTPLDFAVNPPAPLQAPPNSAAMSELLRTWSPERQPTSSKPVPNRSGDLRGDELTADVLAAKQQAYEAGRAAAAAKKATPMAVSYGADLRATEPVQPDSGQAGLRLGLLAVLLLLAGLAGYFIGRRSRSAASRVTNA